MRTYAEPEKQGGEGLLGDGRARPVVLVLDDDVLVLRTLCRVLAGAEFEMVALSETARLSDYLSNRRLAAVLLDLRLGDASGLQVLDAIKRARPEVEVIIMTGYASVDTAVGSMQRGAFDYLSKPFTDLQRIRTTVRQALAQHLVFDPNAPVDFSHSRSASLPVFRVAESLDPPLSLDAYEKLALERALRENGGDAKRAAKALRIGRSTFYRKAARHGLRLARNDAGREARRHAAKSTTASGVGGRISIG